MLKNLKFQQPKDVSIMKINTTVKFTYKNEKQAEISFKSLNPDNIGYIKSYTKDSDLICSLSGDNIGTVLATADDLIFSEMIVEKMFEMITELNNLNDD